MGNNNSKENLVVGTVIEALPNTMFKVALPDGSEILAFLAGKMRLHRIRVLVGDRVEMLMDPYGGKARIQKRL
jgi:translation initiation factor IF-1